MFFAATVYRAPHLNGALSRLLDPRFDPLQAAVLPGPESPTSGSRESGSPQPGSSGSAPPGLGPPLTGAGGRVEVVAAGPESLRLEVEAAGPGALVVRRAHLPIWRAEVDGRPAPVVAANIHHLGVELEAGSHSVRLWVDRRPLWLAGLVALIAGVVILLLAAPLRRSAGW